jgi:hypothetical protein
VKFTEPSARPCGLPEELRRLLSSSAAGEQRLARPVVTGWAAIDAELGRRRSGQPGGLARGAIHEWLGCAGAARTVDRKAARTAARTADRGDWSPPLFLLTHLAWCALVEGAEAGGASGSAARLAVWVGRRVWPYPRALVRDFGVALATSKEARGEQRGSARGEASGEESGDASGAAAAPARAWQLELVRLSFSQRPSDPQQLLARTLFVDPRGIRERLWAIDSALRSPAVGVVVADVSGFDMAASRRLQLAAGEGGGVGIFARPPREERELSAAATRWRVARSAPSRKRAGPGWTLELLRCKGAGAWQAGRQWE